MLVLIFKFDRILPYKFTFFCSGLYPLFKPGSEYCGKACARISVALIHPTIDSNEKFFHEDVDQESDVDGQSSGYPEFEDIDEGKTESSRKHEIPKPKDQRLDVEKDVSTIEETKEGEENGAALVSVEVHIEEASHLPYVENAKNEWYVFKRSKALSHFSCKQFKNTDKSHISAYSQRNQIEI